MFIHGYLIDMDMVYKTSIIHTLCRCRSLEKV